MVDVHKKSKDPKTNEKHRKILEELLKHPENKFCADCRQRGPRWCSVKWGVFICIKCSGVHRHLGTHISRVKSVSEDYFAPDEIELFQTTNNEVMNGSLEARLNPADKISPDASDSSREHFIRAKYENLRFAPRGYVPHFKLHEQQQQQQQQHTAPSSSSPALKSSAYTASRPHQHALDQAYPRPSATTAPVQHAPPHSFNSSTQPSSFFSASSSQPSSQQQHRPIDIITAIVIHLFNIFFYISKFEN